jgi:hypothetical protein
MNIFKNLFSFAALTLVAVFFAAPKQAEAQQTREHILLLKTHVEPQAAAYIKFDGVDGESKIKEGRNVVGRNTRTGEQLIVVVRDGKLAEFGTQSAGGAFKPASLSASPLSFYPDCPYPYCFTSKDGEYICVCLQAMTLTSGR